MPGNEESRMVTEELSALLARNGFEARQPLSASSHRAWQQSLAHASVNVASATLASGGAGWLLTTQTPEAASSGSLVRAALLVRATDWQPLAQTFEFKAQPQNAVYELTETSYAIVAFSEIDPALFGAAVPVETAAAVAKAPTSSASPALPPVPAITTAPVVSAAELLATEIEALRLLNAIGADLGEEVSVKRTPREIIIEATLETDARRQAIRQALESLAQSSVVRLHLTTTAETLAQAPPTVPRTLNPEGQALTAQVMPMANELRRHLQARGVAAAELDEAVTQFAIRIVRRSRQLNLHAWALRNLATRFSVAEVAALDAEAQAKRLNLLQQQGSAWRREMAALTQELAPFLSAANSDAAPIPVITDEAALRQTINRLAQLTAMLDAQTRAAFTVSTETGAIEISTSVFRRHLAEADMLIAAIQNAAR
jgi:hypothetical protein